MLLRLITDGLLVVDRWVFRIVFQPDEVESVNSLVKELSSDPVTQIYLVVDPVTEKTLDIASTMDVSKYIVDITYFTQQPPMLTQFLAHGTHVLYRKLHGRRPIQFGPSQLGLRRKPLRALKKRH